MERILTPPRMRSWESDGWFIFFDPYNFKWVRVNESGRFLIQQFSRYRTVEQVISEVSASFAIPLSEAATAVPTFVDSLVELGFLHRERYRENERIEWSERRFAYAVYLHMTNNCNLKCPYCYNKSDREAKILMAKRGLHEPVLTTDEYKQLIARLVELGARHLFFTGGEPLMRSDLPELLQFTRSLDRTVAIEVLTNAILIREPMAEMLCDYATAVTISLDGHERHFHEHFRGNNTFEPTVRGIRNLIRVRNQRGQQYPKVALVPALTNLNIGSMKNIFEFALDDLGADGLAPIIFQAGDHQELNLQQIPVFEEWTAAQRETVNYVRQRQARIEAEQPPAAGKAAVSKLAPRNHCGVGHGEISVDASGYVYPCQSLHFDEFLCGNVRSQDVKDIFETSPVMLRVRGTRVETLAVCSHCDLRNLCNGGCRATAYNVYRQFDAHNEIYCRHLEKLAVDRLWGASAMPIETNDSACV